MDVVIKIEYVNLDFVFHEIIFPFITHSKLVSSITSNLFQSTHFFVQLTISKVTFNAFGLTQPVSQVIDQSLSPLMPH